MAVFFIRKGVVSVVLTRPGKASFHMGIDLCCCVKQGVLFTTERVEKRAEVLPQEDSVIVGGLIKSHKKENTEG